MLPVTRLLATGIAVCGFSLVLSTSSRLVARAEVPPADPPAFFEQTVRPILEAHCFQCHSHAAKKAKGGLMLDARESVLKGGDRGPAVVPGKPDESLLVKAVFHRSDDLKMPPKGKLADAQVASLREWVRRGAPWAGSAFKLAARPHGVITAEDRAWWAFRPVRAVEPPRVADADWSDNPSDRFIRHRLDAEGLAPSPSADRPAVIRRVTFDLTGLPPTPAEVETFTNDLSPDAYEKLVDRLLASPRYGERMARLWFDVARYAESDGFKADDYRPGAWRYRDYVIKSFNADKPYDRFLKEQLAGDEIAPDDLEALVATGFLRAGIYEYNNRDARTQWDNMLNELTDVVGDAVLGLGVGCAKCHDHKFDPILQRDYFRLKAFFAGLSARDDLPAATERQQSEYRAKRAVWEAKTTDIRARIETLEAPMRAKAEKDIVAKLPNDIQALLHKPAAERSPYEQQLAELGYRQVQYEYSHLDRMFKDEQKQQLVQLRKDLAKFDADKPAPLPEGVVARDVGPVAAPTVVPKKGGGEPVEPGVPSVFDPNPLSVTPPGRPTTGRRTALAAWLTRPDNPLTARVAVNRLWQQHFGRGLVATSSDFGRLGQLPSHPELLDWLARRFVEGGWSVKQIHRLIVLSRSYRQSATHPAPAAAVRTDPEDRLLWRAGTRRLDAEQVRDALLAVTGQLDLTTGGPSVEPAQPRRTVYTKVKRNIRDPLLEVFDAPESFTSTSQRNVTTTPPQALLMVNGPFMLGQAKALAARLARAHPRDYAARLDAAFRLTFGRPPTAAERWQALAFLDAQARTVNPTPDPAATVQYGKLPFHEGRAALVEPGGSMGRLTVPDSPKLPEADFTIEAFVQLRSLYADAMVRPITSHWGGDKAAPGWLFGVTGKKSAYKPQVLVMQLWGETADGKFVQEPVFSNLPVELNKAYFVAAALTLAQDGRNGQVTFYTQDLSNDEDPLQMSQIAHSIAKLPGRRGPLTIGGGGDLARERAWDGLIDDVRLSAGALPVRQLSLTAGAVTDRTCGLWQFEAGAGFFRDSSANRLDITPSPGVSGKPAAAATDARAAAWIDLCHVLLNANEFLYVD
jgi:hypothetical protein